MPHMTSLRFNREMTLRIIADSFLINTAILIALAARFFYEVVFEKELAGAQYNRIFWEYAFAYRDSAWLITLFCFVVFYAGGFYTYGRFYNRRYKALFVAQAVCLSYLLFGFFSYFVGGALALPRGALVLAWLLSAGLLMAARVWSLLWRNVAYAERHLSERPNEYNVRKVLVIGGAGYIGSALLPKLLDKGYRVRLLDLLLYGTEPIQDLLNHPRLEVVQADFRQVDKVVEAMRGMDAVIHLGAIVGDPACDLDKELTIEVNLMATRMIAEVAKGNGVSRFIFASTCSVYGASEKILDEHSALEPLSLYARSKIASEQVLMGMASAGFAPTLLRFGTIYGLSGRTRFDLVVNLLAAKASVNDQITVFGGDQWRPFLHVQDAATAVLKTLEARPSLVRDQIFNVGSNEQNYTIQQVGEIIHRLVPSAELINMGSGTDDRNYRVDFSKIRTLLDFTPQWTVEQGAQQVIDVIKSGKVQDYQNAKYSNVKFLNEESTSRLIRRVNGWAYELINERPSRSLVVGGGIAAQEPEPAASHIDKATPASFAA